MRKKLSAFLLAGILFFAGGTEGVLAAQAGSGSEKIIQDTVSDEGDISPNTGNQRVEKASVPKNTVLCMMFIPQTFIITS